MFQLSPELSAFLAKEFLGNSMLDYSIFIGLLVLGFLFKNYIIKLFSNLFYNSFKQYFFDIEKAVFSNLVDKPLQWLLFLIFLYLAADHIDYPNNWDLAPVGEFGLKMFVHKTYLAFLIFVLLWVALQLVKFSGMVLTIKAEKTEGKQDDQLIGFGFEIIKIITVCFFLLILLSVVFEINIGALIAGIGIGGLAIALAAKETVENLFGSFTIFFDKPFVVDDMVTVGNITGTVERVGFRSTRIRTLEKSYVTVPNKKMIDAELDNLSLRTFRRVKFNIGLTYDTKISLMKSVVSEIQKYIDNHPHTNQDGQIRFMDFGPSSLDIMVLYYIDTMDWDFYLKVREEINYRIMEIVEELGCNFAFPSTTVYLNKEN